jgi:diacylglycerol kinase
VSDRDRPPRRSWPQKFRDAFRGLWIGVRGQNSFAVHLPMAVLVIVAGFVLRVTLVEWCLLVLAVTVVLAAELFNSALESLAKAIDVKHNLHLADGLDIGSGAVLAASFGAAVTGAIVLVYRFGALLAWW